MPANPKIKHLGFRLLALIRLCVSMALLVLFVRVYTSPLAQWAEPRTVLMNLQFSGAVARGGILALIAILWLFLSALFGRWYCGAICPLGAAQEVMTRGAALLTRKRTKHIAPHRLRYAVPFLAGIGLVIGLPPLFVLTDPISSFGRAITGIAGLVTDGTAHPAAWLGIVVFAAILTIAALRGRRFCDWCPVGTVLGLCAGAAPFGMKLDAGLCVSCGKCESVCPMNCADSKNKTLDQGRCVLCLSCAGACPAGAAAYGRTAGREAKAPRRTFFRQAGELFMYASGAIYLFGRLLRRGLRLALPARPDAYSPEEALGTALPPGAQDTEHMDIHCIGCQACVAACPVGILRGSPVHPRLDYSRGYCQYNCMECGRACPAGAIHALTPEEKHTTRIALSEFIKPNCVTVTRGESCGACAEVCPTHALRMVSADGPDASGGLTVPEFDPEYCIGCGGCLNVCPAAAFAVRGVSPQTRTPGVRRSEPEEDIHTFKEGDEFPF